MTKVPLGAIVLNLFLKAFPKNEMPMEQVSKSGKVPNPKKAMYIIDPPTEPAAVEATKAA